MLRKLVREGGDGDDRGDGSEGGDGGDEDAPQYKLR